MISEALIRNQANMITFVLVDNTYTEVAGVGNAFVIEISKAGGAFVAGVGVKAEISDGWYSYILTATECDTTGPLSVRIPPHIAFTFIQQNLEYVVKQRTVNCIEFTYTVTDSETGLPIAGVEVSFTTDVAGSDVVFYGVTDAFGITRNALGELPCLEAATYYVWKYRSGYTPDAWPDTETVS